MATIPTPIIDAISGVAKAFVPSTASKPWYKSKTNWTAIAAGAITAGAAFYPPALAIVLAAPQLVLPIAGGLITVIFMGLRAVTAGRVTLTADSNAITIAPDATAQVGQPIIPKQ